MKRQEHREKTWSNADPRKVGWYQESPDVSLGLVESGTVHAQFREVRNRYPNKNHRKVVP